MTARRRRGVALIVAALAVLVLVGDDRPLDFLYLPMVTGLGYLLAAAVGGRDGSLWGPGLVVTAFGIGAALSIDGPVGGRLFAPVVLTAVGAGAVLALLLPRLGIAVSGLSVASAVLLSGVFFLLTELEQTSGTREPAVYAGLLALWGVFEMRPERTSASSSPAKRDPITP